MISYKTLQDHFPGPRTFHVEDMRFDFQDLFRRQGLGSFAHGGETDISGERRLRSFGIVIGISEQVCACHSSARHEEPIAFP